jgi:hypothetical protein
MGTQIRLNAAVTLGSQAANTLTSLSTLNIRGKGILSAKNVGKESAGADINGN